MSDDNLDYVSITRLYAAYADAVTRRAWDELGPLFVPDVAIHVDRVNADALEFHGAAEFGKFVARSLDRFEFFEFVILNTVVRFRSAGTAGGRLYMVELRQDRESGEWSNAFGVYHDDLTVVGGRWCFASRRYQSLARKVGTGRAEVFPFPGLPL